jgi:hypothetical protein
VLIFLQHEAEYVEILNGVKGDIGARRMTAQFISRYFGTFPNQEEEALNALFDLCEDDDPSVSAVSIWLLHSCKNIVIQHSSVGIQYMNLGW